MAILKQANIDVQGGFAKNITASSLKMVNDILQRFQYSYPIKSTVRELVSNAVDAVSERDMALMILSGKASVEDFYEEIEGDEYQDSKFVPTYYDPKWLSDDPLVYITYHTSTSSEKDYITIRDNGVGLGSFRLRGYFDLGYSTKRLSKFPIGKFGIGGKVALSVSPYFTMESRYNGELFRFNVYSNDAESLIPAFNLETGQRNIEHKEQKFMGYDEAGMPKFEEYVYYSEATTEKNGVTIRFDARKFEQDEYKEAVERQLMYFKNVKFTIQTNGVDFVQNFTPEVLYEDEYLLLSDNKYFAKPHILLGNNNYINYGFVDFKQLELEDISGNIGIKVRPEDVEINPSRESVVWSAKTKQMILQRFKDARQSATNLISRELIEPDFLRWVKTCNSVNQRWTGENIVARLANIVDMTRVKIPYKPNPEIVYHTDLFYGFVVKSIQFDSKFVSNKISKKIKRKVIKNTIFDPTVIVKSTRTSHRKDKYLLSLYPEGFTVIECPETLRTEVLEDEVLFDADDEVTTLNLKIPESTSNRELIWNYLIQSKDIISYESIIVPDSFTGTESEEEILGTENMTPEELALANLSHDERRKVEGKTILFTPRVDIDYTRQARSGDDLYEWQKVEVKMSTINDWNEAEIYYGNDADSDTLKLVALLTRPNKNPDIRVPRGKFYNNRFMEHENLGEDYGVRNNEAFRCAHFFGRKKIKIIKVSRDNTKYYQDFKHIHKFFFRMVGKTITMSNTLIKWNTARKIQARLQELDFLFNFPASCPEKDLYHELVDYVDENYTDLLNLGKITDKNKSAITDLSNHLDKVEQFQRIVREGLSAEEIAAVAQSMWGDSSVEDGHAIDLDLFNKFTNLLNWAKPVSGILSQVTPLTGHDNYFEPYDKFTDRTRHDLTPEFQESVMNFCRDKNLF